MPATQTNQIKSQDVQIEVAPSSTSSATSTATSSGNSSSSDVVPSPSMSPVVALSPPDLATISATQIVSASPMLILANTANTASSTVATNARPNQTSSAMMGQPSQIGATTTANHLMNPQGESKRCNCKKSRCLKLYCECFAANVFCKGCKCKDCHNVPEHQADRLKAIEYKLSRRPRAFEPKFQPNSASVAMGDSGDPMRHSRGCNCKKSGCEKKYCECYQNGVSCTSMCKCQECRNDGSLPHLRNFGVIEWRSPAMSRADFECAAMARPEHPVDFIPGQEASFTFVPYHVAQQQAQERALAEAKAKQKAEAREARASSARVKRAASHRSLGQTSKRVKHHRTNSAKSISSAAPVDTSFLVSEDMTTFVGVDMSEDLLELEMYANLMDDETKRSYQDDSSLMNGEDICTGHPIDSELCLDGLLDPGSNLNDKYIDAIDTDSYLRSADSGHLSSDTLSMDSVPDAQANAEVVRTKNPETICVKSEPLCMGETVPSHITEMQKQNEIFTQNVDMEDILSLHVDEDLLGGNFIS